MIIRVCHFTEQGETIEQRLIAAWEDAIFQVRSKEVTLTKWVQEGFERRLPILFIGACGIAVRSIAPFVKDKLEDSPVLVMDEQGRFVIPVLSGHMGGANFLAEKIAGMLGAQAVVTTATDVERVFSVDEFARQNGFEILEREGIKRISSKLLRGEEIRVAISPQLLCDGGLPDGLIWVPFETPSVDLRILTRQDIEQIKEAHWEQALRLVAKEIVIGVGCKKGKSFAELQDFLLRHCPYDLEKEIYAITSIDLKKKEEGLWGIAQYYHIPFITYSAQELQKVQGDFSQSAFVQEVTGVSNVCERAALCLANGGELLQGKIAENGMTLAIARRIPKIRVW